MRLEEMPLNRLFRELGKSEHAYKFSVSGGKASIEIDEIPDASVEFG